MPIFFQEQVLKTALECEARPGWHLKFDVIDMKKQVLPSFINFFLAHGWAEELARVAKSEGKELQP